MITMNEEKAIHKVISDIMIAVPDAEVLVVDSSTDHTPEIAEKLGARVIRQFPPKGYGAAMARALESSKGDVIVTLDCDDTYPTDQIAIMADMVLSGRYDLVDGSRLRNKPQAMPMINYLANWGFARLASILFLKNLTDLHSGMRAYRKSMLDSLKFDPHGAALPVELLLLPIKHNYKYKNHFIEYRERIGQSTMQPLDSAKWTLKRIINVKLWK